MSTNDVRFIKKPWGSEELIELNAAYMFKKLTMWQGHRCSLQFHNKKIETIYVVSGLLKIYIGDTKDSLDFKVYSPGDFVTLLPGVIHRMEAVQDCIYLEASTPEMDDVVRITDDYLRV